MSHNQSYPGSNATPTADTGSPLTNRQAREHSHPCPWPGCSRSFAGPWNVQQHIREKHTFERPYKCDDCAADGIETAFTRQYGLNRHKVQMHDYPSRSSRAAQVAGGAESTAQATAAWTQLPPGGANEEFGEMRNLLTRANADVGAGEYGVELPGNQFQFDAEQPDVQFQFDAEQSNSVSGAQDNGAYTCGDCNYSAASQVHVLYHCHAVHQAPSSRFCSCNICSAMYLTNQDEAVNHANFLGNGGFLAGPDYGYVQNASTMDVEPQGVDTTAWPTDNCINIIDPALLLSGAGDGTFSQGHEAFGESWQ